MIIGYCRVSTHDQCLDRQTDILTDAGCERIYQEKVSGATKERPELHRMLDALREGDTVIVTELSRLSRTVKDLFSLVEQIHHAGANIKSLKEGNYSSLFSPVYQSSKEISSGSARKKVWKLPGREAGMAAGHRQMPIN